MRCIKNRQGRSGSAVGVSGSGSCNSSSGGGSGTGAGVDGGCGGGCGNGDGVGSSFDGGRARVVMRKPLAKFRKSKCGPDRPIDLLTN